MNNARGVSQTLLILVSTGYCQMYHCSFTVPLSLQTQEYGIEKKFPLTGKMAIMHNKTSHYFSWKFVLITYLIKKCFLLKENCNLSRILVSNIKLVRGLSTALFWRKKKNWIIKKKLTTATLPNCIRRQNTEWRNARTQQHTQICIERANQMHDFFGGWIKGTKFEALDSHLTMYLQPCAILVLLVVHHVLISLNGVKQCIWKGKYFILRQMAQFIHA